MVRTPDRLRPAWRLAVLLLALGMSGCQFLQNEFVTLDVARPAPVEVVD